MEIDEKDVNSDSDDDPDDSSESDESSVDDFPQVTLSPDGNRVWFLIDEEQKSIELDINNLPYEQVYTHLQYADKRRYRHIPHVGKPKIKYAAGTTYTDIVEKLSDDDWFLDTVIPATNEHEEYDPKYNPLPENQYGLTKIKGVFSIMMDQKRHHIPYKDIWSLTQRYLLSTFV